MESFTQDLQVAIDELTRIGADPNHTDEQIQEAIKRVHSAKRRAMESSRKYADMIRRNAEARKLQRPISSRGTDLPTGAVMRHRHSRMNHS